jgi:ribonuclease R
MISPDQILEFLRTPGYAPTRRRGLAKMLGVPEDEYPAFRALMEDLEKQGRIATLKGRRYALPHAAGQVSGEIRIKGAGFGFVPDPDQPEYGDIFVRSDDTADAMDGDTVIVEPFRRRHGGRRQGRVTRVIARRSGMVVGVFEPSARGGRVIVTDRCCRAPIDIPPGADAGAKRGDRVAVKIIEFRRYPGTHRGEIAEVLGQSGGWDVERRAIIISRDLREEFPEDVEAAARAIPRAIGDTERRRRLDLTRETVFTIDPDDAQDFDDAVSVERLADGSWQLGVHIADVSAFVPDGGSVDREARLRCTSVYMPGCCLPMLPESLSSGLCSLRPGEERLTKTVTMTVSADGKREKFTISRSIIRSAARLTYDQVKTALDDNEPGVIPPPVFDMLQDARDLAALMRRRRFEHGGLDLDMPEPRILLTGDGAVAGVSTRRGHYVHQLIEDFMLAANQSVAECLADAALPAIYRVHEAPSEESLAKFADFIRGYGLSIKPPWSIHKLQRISESVEGKDWEHAVRMGLLRSLMLARYDPRCLGHYALAFDRYCHFTSPIRRYPDLFVHRVLEACFPPGERELPRSPRKAHSVTRAWLDAAGRDADRMSRISSKMERNADRAENDAVEFRLLQYLKANAGTKVHEGVIASVEEYGAFVTLNDFFVDALLPVATLEPSDYYHYDAPHRRFRGMKTGAVYRAGDRVGVRVIDIDLVRRQIDVRLMWHEEMGKTARKNSKQHERA